MIQQKEPWIQKLQPSPPHAVETALEGDDAEGARTGVDWFCADSDRAHATVQPVNAAVV